MIWSNFTNQIVHEVVHFTICYGFHCWLITVYEETVSRMWKFYWVRPETSMWCTEKTNIRHYKNDNFMERFLPRPAWQHRLSTPSRLDVIYVCFTAVAYSLSAVYPLTHTQMTKKLCWVEAPRRRLCAACYNPPIVFSQVPSLYQFVR
jgi:hypothetical protein